MSTPLTPGRSSSSETQPVTLDGVLAFLETCSAKERRVVHKMSASLVILQEESTQAQEEPQVTMTSTRGLNIVYGGATINLPGPVSFTQP